MYTHSKNNIYSICLDSNIRKLLYRNVDINDEHCIVLMNV